MTTEATTRRQTQKLQRAIVDGLEDVKAQDLKVFNTEHLSALFERVIIASGTSNRQTKALANSVRDAVREAGFPKPRVEGEANGEWIIVDCGRAVVHVMQPAIRSYYNLEEIWGGTPVRLKLGADKPAPARSSDTKAAVAPMKSSLVATNNVATTKKTLQPRRAAPDGTAVRKTAAAKTVSSKTAAKKTAATAPTRGTRGTRSAAGAATRATARQPVSVVKRGARARRP
ncbi:MAG: Ribosomal silencing factor RsfA [Burkholderiaceae bacterium]|jgi:ribosome-associated protein|nr:MAG: Ribosomal silencing factor RsfA [Burkholderiaceae bacterium]